MKETKTMSNPDIYVKGVHGFWLDNDSFVYVLQGRYSDSFYSVVEEYARQSMDCIFDVDECYKISYDHHQMCIYKCKWTHNKSLQFTELQGVKIEKKLGGGSKNSRDAIKDELLGRHLING